MKYLNFSFDRFRIPNHFLGQLDNPPRSRGTGSLATGVLLNNTFLSPFDTVTRGATHYLPLCKWPRGRSSSNFSLMLVSKVPGL